MVFEMLHLGPPPHHVARPVHVLVIGVKALRQNAQFDSPRSCHDELIFVSVELAGIALEVVHQFPISIPCAIGHAFDH